MRFSKFVACAAVSGSLISAAAIAQIRTVALPDEVSFPEGIAYDAANGQIYTAGAIDGAVARTDIRSGKSEILVQAGALPGANTVFPAFLGMKVDNRSRLWIGGGRTGYLHVLDTISGKAIKSLRVPGDGSVLNDLVVTDTHAYIVDTFRPTLWRVAINGGEIGEMEPWLSWQGIAQYGTSPNMNGIAKTPDNRFLFVGHMTRGEIYRIDTATKEVRRLDLGAEDVTSADGLELAGTRLYLVRQGPGEVVSIQLTPDMTAGKVVARVKDPSLMLPATAVSVGNELLVVNTQFNRRSSNDPARPFRITAIPLLALQRP